MSAPRRPSLSGKLGDGAGISQKGGQSRDYMQVAYSTVSGKLVIILGTRTEQINALAMICPAERAERESEL